MVRRMRSAVISASGMCDAGRIKHHLLQNLPRSECSILITGFQAQGTLGRRLVDGEKKVRIFGENIPVRASIHTVGCLSAHADRQALLDWAGHFRQPPKHTYVVHGEENTALEFADTLRADAVLQNKLNSLPNVTVIKSAQTTEVTGDGQKVNGLRYKDRVSGEEKQVELEGIFVQIGLLPNTDWLKGSVELSKFGEIVIDAKGQTSLPGVFAAGDCTTVPYKQIVIAMGEGSKAALSAFDHLIRA